MDYGIDIMEVLRRAAKYLVEGLAVALAAYLVPKSKLALGEIVILASVAAAIFAILDLYSPSIGASTRVGAGIGLGGGIIGGFPVAR
jgi:ABC-type Co2+ transport system permease subunit